MQTESRIGHDLNLSLIAGNGNGSNSLPLSFAAAGFAELKGVADGKFTLAWINPSVAVTLAYRGTGPFQKKLPLRVIATFPSYDVMGFAVRKSTGITSLAQIAKERFPLRLSTNVTSKEAINASPTMFTVVAVMKAAGFTLADLKKWGGKVVSVSRPSHPDRRDAIQNGTVNAVFDEGIKSWGQTAVDSGFVYLPIEGELLRRLAKIGYRTSIVPKARFKGMARDVPTVDFSGWPIYTSEKASDKAIRAFCIGLQARADRLIVDGAGLPLEQMVRDTPDGPLEVPFHPAAEAYWRETGYLK